MGETMLLPFLVLRIAEQAFQIDTVPFFIGFHKRARL